MGFSKTIQMYIFDGNPNGRIMCELSNWNGRVYKISRNELSAFSKRDDAEHTGVYFLFGKDATNADTIYIGEAEKMFSRIKQHLKDETYWSDCIAVISKDNLLNKAHVKFLENKFYSLAQNANRAVIVNNSIPTLSSVSEYDEAMLYEFISNTRLLVNTLGYKVFASDEEDIALWYIYTQVHGVRIKVKSAMFGSTMLLEEHTSGYIPVTKISPIKIDTGFSTDSICHVKGPIKISYVSDIKEIYSSAVSKSVANKGKTNEFIMNDIYLDELGMKKTIHWSYENEWRFKASPYIETHGSNEALNSPVKPNMPKYIDIPLKASIEEIMLAPQISEKDKSFLFDYLAQNNLKIPVIESRIKTNFNY